MSQGPKQGFESLTINGMKFQVLKVSSKLGLGTKILLNVLNI